MEEFTDEQRKDLREIIKQEISNAARNDVDAEGIGSSEIGLLSGTANNTQLINKINELINSFNKTLRDYRI